MRYKILILMFVIVLFSNIFSATVQLGNLSHKIDTSYTKSQVITGWINISLEDEPADTLISGFNASMTLRNFLDENDIACNVIGPYECSCFPKDCEPTYTTTGSQYDERTYSMAPASSQLFGIKLTENISQITEFRFNISTNAKDSCLNPILIDLFDDQNIEFRIAEISDSECFIENPFGCYKSKDSVGDTTIGTDHLCGKIAIPPARGFKVGANLIGTGSATIFMTLEAGGSESDCTILVTSGGKNDCTIDLGKSTGGFTEAEVCIYAEEGSEGIYRINFEDIDTCGYIGDFSGPKHDFDIFAIPLKYKSPSQLTFDQSFFDEEALDLNTLIFDYINGKYNADCSPECIIPIRIYSGIQQNLVVSDLLLDYNVEGLDPASSEERNFYNLESIEALYTAEFLQLNLPGIFFTPSIAGSVKFILDIGNARIEEDITVIDIPEINNIVPNSVAFSVPTNFIVILNPPSGDGGLGNSSSGNYSSSNSTLSNSTTRSSIYDDITYIWDFGDGTPIETTASNVLQHTYSALGSYQLKVNLSNDLGTTGKTITVNVLAPYDAINDTLFDYKQKLKNIDNSLFVLSSWLQERINKVLNIDDLKSTVNGLENKYKELLRVEEEALVKIMISLNELDIPYKLDVPFEIKGARFIQSKDRLNLLVLEEFGAGNFDGDKEEYYSAINRWMNDNLDIDIDSKTYSFYYDDQREQVVLSDVRITLTPKTNIEEFYMIIDGDTNRIKFLEDYRQREIDDTKYGIIFRDLIAGETQKIEFSYPERIELFNPPIYVSPEFRNIEFGSKPGICNNNNICEANLGENYKNCRVDCKPLNWLIVFFVILFISAFIAYIVLQEWYKRRYEKHLFKNKSQLFNLITFMNNGVNQKLTKRQILGRLKSLRWSREQLNYAWKKLKGKRTGMWEIPIFKIFEKRKVKKEIAKRKSMYPGSNLNTPPTKY